MSIRAKMKCQSVSKDVQNENVTLFPVTTGSDENKQWAKWTPGGQLQLSISNPEAMGKFVPGAEYFVDVTAVPVPEAAPATPDTTPPV